MKLTVITLLILFIQLACTSCTYRNAIETVWIENCSNVLHEKNLNIALELRHERKVIPFNQCQEFLKSDESLGLTDEIRKTIESKTAKVTATLTRAKKERNQDMILLRPDRGKPFSSDNMVLYIKSKKEFNTFFSIEEIDQYIIQYWVKLDDDLEGVIFLDYEYRSETLERLTNKLHALNFILPSFPTINQEEAAIRREALKIDKAADLILRALKKGLGSHN